MGFWQWGSVSLHGAAAYGWASRADNNVESCLILLYLNISDCPCLLHEHPNYHHHHAFRDLFILGHRCNRSWAWWLGCRHLLCSRRPQRNDIGTSKRTGRSTRSFHMRSRRKTPLLTGNSDRCRVANHTKVSQKIRAHPSSIAEGRKK